MLEENFQRYSAREALIDANTRFRYGELAASVRHLAGCMANAGFSTGEMLVLWAPNSWQWVVSALACWWLGGIVLPLSARLKALDVYPVLAETGAGFLFTSSDAHGADLPAILQAYLQDRGRDIETALPGLHTIVDFDLARCAPTGLSTPWDSFLASAPDSLPKAASVAPDAPCQVLFSSGTTGRPKGVVRMHAQALRARWNSSWERDYTEADRNLVVPQYSHTAGLNGGLLLSVIRGMAHVVVRHYSPLATLELIRRERVSAMQGPPSLFSALLANRDPSLLRQLRFVATGASPIPPQLIHALRAAGVGFVCSSYALTECNIATATSRDDPPDVVAHSVGRPSPGINLKLVDERGEEVADGEAGEILLQGYAVMAGYLGDARLTSETITPDGWLRTGDIGRLRDDGNLQVVGRKKEMIIVHGYNVFPAEVEMQLLASGLLDGAAVIAKTSRLAGEELVAFVVPARGLSVDRKAVAAWARKNMANYKVPSRFILRDNLPLNLNGKIDKIALQKSLSEP